MSVSCTRTSLIAASLLAMAFQVACVGTHHAPAPPAALSGVSTWSIDEYFSYAVNAAAARNEPAAIASFRLFFLFADVTDPRRRKAERALSKAGERLDAEILERSQRLIARLTPPTGFFPREYPDQFDTALRGFAAVDAWDAGWSQAGEYGEMRLVELRAAKGDLDGALELFRRAQRRAKGGWSATRLLVALARDGRTSAAEEVLETIEDEARVDATIEFAEAEFQRGAPEEARRRLRALSADLSQRRPAEPDEIGTNADEVISAWELKKIAAAQDRVGDPEGAAASFRMSGGDANARPVATRPIRFVPRTVPVACKWAWIVEDKALWDSRPDARGATEVDQLERLVELRTRIDEADRQETIDPKAERAHCGRS